MTDCWSWGLTIRSWARRNCPHRTHTIHTIHPQQNAGQQDNRMLDNRMLKLLQQIIPSAVTRNWPLKFQTLAVLTGLSSPTRSSVSTASTASLVSRTPSSLKQSQVPLRLFQGHRHFSWKTLYNARIGLILRRDVILCILLALSPQQMV